MELSIDATYEDGVLKPSAPLPLAEHAKVHVTVHEGGEEFTGAEFVRGNAGERKRR
jgi:predicted DNA-binding antitoxin AbrB/MazE fold protein